MPNAQGTTKGSRSVADLRHDKCGRILNTTLNPTIIFPSVVSANLFANLDTYSQVAGCTPDKIVSQCARLSRLNPDNGFSDWCVPLRHAASFIADESRM